MEQTAKPYMNSYLAGILLGLLLLATIYITGRGLGASGALKSVVVKTVNTIAPTHAENTPFYKSFTTSNHGNPMRNWLVFEVIGVIIGAFVSGLIANRSGFKLERGNEKLPNKTRIATAIIGGLLFGLGSQFGRGCTSGAALTGMAVMSLGGILTMFSIFGSGYAVAYFFRKLWLNK
jgi:uncharacterized membrane protein YedE/YeeE